jgi:hypothetical protein
MYDPTTSKTDEERNEERELQDTIMQLHAQYRAARANSAEERMILRQMDGIRRGSELGGLLMEEYHLSAGHPDW